MAAINDLISQIDDEELKKRITEELEKLTNQKKFGLVFEEHLPECVPLYDVPIKKGCKVALKAGKVNEYYTVMQVEGDNVYCTDKKESQLINFLKKDLVCIAEFGESIYPYLKQIDSIYKSDDKELPTHALIQADNYHALQLLEYLYAGKVDCIYIDPPYNTGARDWKYNNDYVDSSDIYRHSKWLSMMKKRMLLAKKLLNPNDSVMIVTIDDKEFLHLGCLLEDLFPEARIQMVSITINPSGAITEDMFAKSDEYAFFVFMGKSKIYQQIGDGKETEVRWWYLRRLEYGSRRGTVKGGTAQFYPIYIDNKSEKIVKIGAPLPHTQDRNTVEQIPGTTTVFPIRDDGLEMNWGVTGETLKRLLNENVVQVLKNKNTEYQPYTIKYLSENYKEKIESGRWAVKGYRDDGSKIVVETGGKVSRATTVWRDKLYESKTNGTLLLKNIIGPSKFSYPKSLYAVHDTLQYCLAEKKNAIIIDFFAGSGTTMHAVNLLNSEDNGKRQCILVTNNEVSEEESKKLISQGFNNGDSEWEKLGIAQCATWPRNKLSILGVDFNNIPLKDEYIINGKKEIIRNRKIKQLSINLSNVNKTLQLKKQIISLIDDKNLKVSNITSDSEYLTAEEAQNAILFNIEYLEEFIELITNTVETIYVVTDDDKEFNKIKLKLSELPPIKTYENQTRKASDGFKANAVFFKLGFLDKTSVQLGRQFKELLPLLWLKAGGWAKCPESEKLIKDNILPPYIILPENHFAVLIDEKFFSEFESRVNSENEIWTAYIVTDFEKGFKSMTKNLNVKKSYQLYRDYLDNFRINTERN